jgi:ABC transporter substrate binding protein
MVGNFACCARAASGHAAAAPPMSVMNSRRLMSDMGRPARPGGNVTGLSIQSADLAGKRIELLREVLPSLRRLAIIANVGYSGSVLEMGEAQAAARKLGLDVDVLEIRRVEDIASAFETLKSGVQALYVCPDPLVNANHARINTLHSARDCRRFIPSASISERQVSCPMDRSPRTCFGAPATTSTRFCVE